MKFEDPLIIDWAQTHFYNTIMSIAAGAGLCMIAAIMRALLRNDDIRPRGWSVNFLVVGLLVFGTGIHMVLTWPLAPRFAYDNIIFGEPMAMFGAILLGLARYFSVRATDIEQAEHPISFIAEDLRNLRFLLYGAAGSLIAISLAALTWGLFIAPKEEPIAGITATLNIQWTTNIAMAAIYTGIGVCAALVPSMLLRHSTQGAEVTRVDLGVVTALKWLGISLLAVGAFVTYTHIGMVINTSDVIPH